MRYCRTGVGVVHVGVYVEGALVKLLRLVCIIKALEVLRLVIELIIALSVDAWLRGKRNSLSLFFNKTGEDLFLCGKE